MQGSVDAGTGELRGFMVFGWLRPGKRSSSFVHRPPQTISQNPKTSIPLTLN